MTNGPFVDSSAPGGSRAAASARLRSGARAAAALACQVLALAACLGSPATAWSAAPAPAALPALGLAADGVTVSGLSSGGYMAGQFQVAFADSLTGAAVLAAGPYGCSRGSVYTAMQHCACPVAGSVWQASLRFWPLAACSVPGEGLLAAFADSALTVNARHLDPPQALAKHRVWLLSGQADPVVPPTLVTAAEAFYRRHGVADAQLHHERVPGAGHGLPTPDGPVACGVTASPFLTDCRDLDSAGALLAWLYPAPAGGVQAGVARAAGLRRFDQRPYRQRAVFDGLDDSGWLYVPQACETGRAAATTADAAVAPCRLHVVFHGCAQGQGFVGADGRPFGRRFVDGAGYNRWAEASRIVLLYPQVKASRPTALAQLAGDAHRLNPEGCWDFWGYTDPQGALHGTQRHFARRSAPQLRAVKAMVDAVLRPAP